MNIILRIAEILVLVGAINWGLIGFFNNNVVESLFGGNSTLTKIIYILVGVSAILLIIAKFIPMT